MGQLLSWVPLWPFALVEHFRVQMVVGGVVIAIACAAVRSRWFDAVVLATLLHLTWLVPDLSRVPGPVPADGRPVRVLLLNVLAPNTQYGHVRRLITETGADLVALVEFDASWQRELAPAVADYPVRIEYPRTDKLGLALYARAPLAGDVQFLGQWPSLVATLAVEGGPPLGIVLTHPYPPVSTSLLRDLEEQLAAIAARIQLFGTPALVLGDFNATPWSRPFRAFAEASGLCDTRAGFGLQASWPVATPPLRIPIDHALVSCVVGVRGRRIERDVGSDHLPVVIDLVLPR